MKLKSTINIVLILAAVIAIISCMNVNKKQTDKDKVPAFADMPDSSSNTNTNKAETTNAVESITDSTISNKNEDAVAANNTVALKKNTAKQEGDKAAWMRQAKFGIFVHYMQSLQNDTMPWNMGKNTSWDSCVNAFNVNLFAKQINDIGAGYVIFTVYQGNRYMCIPNETYEKATGYKRGQATSNRDLVADLSAALNKYNIKLILYVTGDGTWKDAHADAAFDNPQLHRKANNNKFIPTSNWANKWSAVLREISLRYGNKISGWWVDGASKSFHNYNDSLLGILYKALTAGNPQSIVAFNPAPLNKVSYYSKWDDYTAGEMNDFKDTPPAGGKINGAQWHILSFLGTYWKRPNIRYTKQYLTNYINNCNRLGGVFSIDAAVFRNGSIAPNQLSLLKQVGEGIK